MPRILSHPDGAVLFVRVQPGAKKNNINGIHDGALKVSVQSPPEDGKANDAIVELLGKSLGVKKSQVQLISGHTHREKKFLVTGMKVEGLVEKILGLVR